jgi:hypothetical protein
MQCSHSSRISASCAKEKFKPGVEVNFEVTFNCGNCKFNDFSCRPSLKEFYSRSTFHWK